MKQKIEWYKEVLELEPGSRVFFPLSKLLAADGQTSEAVFTLKQGLLRHPDHVEARLLLVELLHLQDQNRELQAELDGLGALFASYPGFWSAWSEKLSETPALHDAALAMRFFSAALQGKQVSWSAIIQQGLHSLLTSGHQPQSEAVVRASEAPLASPIDDAVVAPEQAIHDSAQYVQQVHEDLQPSYAPVYHDEAAAYYESQDDDSDEAFSLRTRSMAEVLAEQGDLSGALDIYTELMQDASSDELVSLQERADELRAKLHSSPASQDEVSVEKSASSGSESTRLVSLLESLAQRLEARAR